jgi:transcriptional regulator with XRE-family HTH domain
MKDRIRILRKDLGLTLEEVADLVGSCKSYVWELEKRDSKPSAEKLYKIAEALETTIEYLLFGYESDINEVRLLRSFRKMDGEDQIKLLRVASVLA